MSVTPEQSQPPLDVMISQLMLLQQAAQTCAPVHLSATCSINLAHVIRYEEVELAEPFEQMDAKGKMKTVYPIGTNAPQITFTDGEGIILLPEQNDVFRAAWARYARLQTAAAGLIDVLFQAAPPPATETIQEQGGEPS